MRHAIWFLFSPNEQQRGGRGEALPGFFFYYFSLLQQTTSGIGSRIKSFFRVDNQHAVYSSMMVDFSPTLYCSAIYFQNAYFIPIVGVGKERRTLIGLW